MLRRTSLLLVVHFCFLFDDIMELRLTLKGDTNLDIAEHDLSFLVAYKKYEGLQNVFGALHGTSDGTLLGRPSLSAEPSLG